jgi:TP901 family phage tail tape measure protein
MGDTVAAISFKFSAEGADRVTKAINQIKINTKTTVDAIVGLTNALKKLDRGGLAGLRAEFNKTKTASQTLAAQVKKQEAALTQLQAQYKKQTTTITQLRAELAKLKAAQTGATGAMSKHGTGIRNLIPHVAAVTLSYMAMRRAVNAVTTAIAAGANFEQQMAIVAGIVRATADDFRMLSEAARVAGETTVWTATEAANALRFLGMAGFDAVESMESLKGVLNLALIGELDLGRATDIATDTLRAFGLEATQLNKVVDVFVGTITRSNTNIESMGQAMKYVAPVAAKLGYTVEQVSAMIGVLSQSGIKSGIAGRALRMSFLKSAQAAAVLGIESTNLIDVLKELNSRNLSPDNLTATLKDLFGIRSTPALLTLIAGMDQVEAFTETLNNAQGETDKFIERLDTTTVEFRKLGSVVTDVAIEAFLKYAGSLKEGISRLREYITEHRDDIIGVFDDMIQAGKDINLVLVPALKAVKLSLDFIKVAADGIEAKSGGEAVAGGLIGRLLTGSWGPAKLLAFAYAMELFANSLSKISKLEIKGPFAKARDALNDINYLLDTMGDEAKYASDWWSNLFSGKTSNFDEAANRLGVVKPVLDDLQIGFLELEKAVQKTNETIWYSILATRPTEAGSAIKATIKAIEDMTTAMENSSYVATDWFNLFAPGSDFANDPFIIRTKHMKEYADNLKSDLKLLYDTDKKLGTKTADDLFKYRMSVEQKRYDQTIKFAEDKFKLETSYVEKLTEEFAKIDNGPYKNFLGDQVVAVYAAEMEKLQYVKQGSDEALEIIKNAQKKVLDVIKDALKEQEAAQKAHNKINKELWEENTAALLAEQELDQETVLKTLELMDKHGAGKNKIWEKINQDYEKMLGGTIAFSRQQYMADLAIYLQIEQLKTGMSNAELEKRRSALMAYYTSTKEASALDSIADELARRASYYKDIEGFEDVYHDKMIDMINARRDAEIAAGEDVFAANAKATQEIAQMDLDLFKKRTKYISDGLSDLQSAFTAIAGAYAEGSRGAEMWTQAAQAMEIAQRAVAVVNAVAAVAAAATAPFPVGFAAMAAMAASMIALLASIGESFGGGGGAATASAPELPASTVLGGAAGQGSESIANSWEMLKETNADQYGELIKIYNELQDLNQNLTGLVTEIIKAGTDYYAGGSVTTQFESSMQKIFNTISLEDFNLDPFTGWVIDTIGGYLFGGEETKTVLDAGIDFNPQQLSDIMNGMDVSAKSFATILTEVSEGLFGGGDSSSERIWEDLDENVIRLLNKVFTNIGDSFESLAIGLGTSIEDVYNYILPGGDIDLKGMDADAANEAIQNYFSNLTDTMAEELFGDILKQYQQIGEGLYETAVRVVMEKEIIIQSLKTLGKSFTGFAADSEAFAEGGIFFNTTFSDGLASLEEQSVALAQAMIEAAGSLEEFVDAYSAYVDAFYSEEEKQLMLQEQLTNAFASINEMYGEMAGVLPDTREGFRALMDSLILMTEYGTETYIALMKLSEAADAYYDSIEDAIQTIVDAQNTINDLSDKEVVAQKLGVSPESLTDEIMKMWVDAFANATVEQIKAVAMAMGMSVEELTDYMLAFNKMLDETADALKKTVEKLQDIFDKIQASIDEINWYIKNPEGNASDFIKSQMVPIINRGESEGYTAGDLEMLGSLLNDWYYAAMNEAKATKDAALAELDAWERLLDAIEDTIKSIKYSNLNVGVPQEKLAEATMDYEALKAAAMGGDADAMQKFMAFAPEYLRMAQDELKSSTAYQAEYARVLADLEYMKSIDSGVGTEASILAEFGEAVAQIETQFEAASAYLIAAANALAAMRIDANGNIVLTADWDLTDTQTANIADWLNDETKVSGTVQLNARWNPTDSETLNIAAWLNDIIKIAGTVQLNARWNSTDIETLNIAAWLRNITKVAGTVWLNARWNPKDTITLGIADWLNDVTQVSGTVQLNARWNLTDATTLAIADWLNDVTQVGGSVTLTFKQTDLNAFATMNSWLKGVYNLMYGYYPLFRNNLISIAQSCGGPSYEYGGMSYGPESGYMAQLDGNELIISSKASYPATVVGGGSDRPIEINLSLEIDGQPLDAKIKVIARNESENVRVNLVRWGKQNSPRKQSV